MAYLKVSRKQRLVATITVSLSFFVAELAGKSSFPLQPPGSRYIDTNWKAGVYTHSLALVADSFHYVRA